MDSLDFINEKEASELTGVSIATLLKFAEAGYLQIEEGEPHGYLFSKHELVSVFGLGEFGTEETAEHQPKESEGIVKTPPSIQTTQSTPIIKTHIISDSSSKLIRLLDQEIAKLQALLETKSELIATKDSEIHDLKDQRDWLKKRLERLEEKGDRDQLLLLAETQAIRQLINIQEKKKSNLRLALEWFGIAPSGEGKVVTIENREVRKTNQPQKHTNSLHAQSHHSSSHKKVGNA